MMQSRTHNCGELRAQHAGEHVKLVGWMENVREVGGSLFGLPGMVIGIPIFAVLYTLIRQDMYKRLEGRKTTEE